MAAASARLHDVSHARRVGRLASLGLGRRTVGTSKFGKIVILFPFHSPVLEPDLDLSLTQAQRMRDLDAPSAGEVAVEVKFFLQFQRLVARVRLTCTLRVTVAAICHMTQHVTQTRDV